MKQLAFDTMRAGLVAAGADLCKPMYCVSTSWLHHFHAGRSRQSKSHSGTCERIELKAMPLNGPTVVQCAKLQWQIYNAVLVGTPVLTHTGLVSYSLSSFEIWIWGRAAMALAIVLVVFALMYLCRILAESYVWRPAFFRKIMAKQGVVGLRKSTSPETGRVDAPMKAISHDLLPHVLPGQAAGFHHFGAKFLNFWRPEPRVVLRAPDDMKKLLLRTPEHFGKSPVLARLGDDVFHLSIFDANDTAWSYHKKLLTPVFSMDNVKTMLQTMSDTTGALVENWDKLVENGEAEIKADVDLRHLTRDMISRTVFRSTYQESKKMFELLDELLRLQGMQFPHSSRMPFVRFLPTRINRQRWRCRRELDGLIVSHILEHKSRSSARRDNKDIVGVLIDALERGDEFMSKQAAVDEFKTFMVTGHSTSTALLSWAMLLLALHPEWQDKARSEVEQLLSEDGVALADFNTLKKLKTVEMVLRETMRLYPPMPLIPRVALKDSMAGDLHVPKGMGFTLSVLATHHDPSLWGEDVNEFDPSRFASGGASASRHPMGFMPFSFGGRACIGQNYASLQSKLVMAAILSKFKWRLSPNYLHDPFIAGPLLPKHGLQILLKTSKSK